MAKIKDYTSVDVSSRKPDPSLDSRTCSLFKILMGLAVATAAVGVISWVTTTKVAKLQERVGPAGPAATYVPFLGGVINSNDTSAVLVALAVTANTSTVDITALKTRMSNTETLVASSSPLVTAVLQAGTDIAAHTTTLAGIAATDASQTSSITALNTLTTTLSSMGTSQAAQISAIQAVDVAQSAQIALIGSLNNTITANLTSILTTLAGIATTDASQTASIAANAATLGTHTTTLAGIATTYAAQTTSITALNAASASQLGAINGIISVDAAQNASLATLTTTGATQATSIIALNAASVSQQLAINGIISVDAAQNASLATLTATGATQATSITTLSASSASQTSSITALSASGATQSAAIAAIISVDTAQNASLSTLANGVSANAASLTTQGAAITSSAASLATHSSLIASLNQTVATHTGLIGANTVEITGHTGTLAQHTTQISNLLAAPAGGVYNANVSLVWVPLVLTATTEFFGDSITASVGGGYVTATANRYSTRLITLKGVLEANFALTGASVFDTGARVYANHVTGRTAFVDIGINDITSSVSVDSMWGQLEHTLTAMAMYLSLPSANIVSSRVATQTGTWAIPSLITQPGNANAYATLGASNSVPGSTIGTTVTGRFVVIAFACFAQGSTVTIAVDGVNVIAGTGLKLDPIPTGFSSSFAVNYVYIHDTTTTGSHTVLVTVMQTGGVNTQVQVDYFAGFNLGDLISDVFMISLDRSDFLPVSNTVYATVARFQTYRTMLKTICYNMRETYQARTWYVEASEGHPLGHLNPDGLHPNDQGHAYIFQRILHVMNLGEWTKSLTLSTGGGTSSIGSSDYLTQTSSCNLLPNLASSGFWTVTAVFTRNAGLVWANITSNSMTTASTANGDVGCALSPTVPAGLLPAALTVYYIPITKNGAVNPTGVIKIDNTGSLTVAGSGAFGAGAQQVGSTGYPTTIIIRGS
jgi:hypothetical protein